MTYGVFRDDRDRNSPPHEDFETAIALIAQVLDRLSYGVKNSASSKALLAAEKRIYALEQKLDFLETGYAHNFATLKAVIEDKIEDVDNRITRNTEEIWRYIQEDRKL